MTNAELGFSFELPNDATEEHSEDPDTLYEYSVSRGECTIRVSISRGHELLDPDPVSLRNSSALKKRIPGISVEDRVWSTFTLEGYRIPTTLDGYVLGGIRGTRSRNSGRAVDVDLSA